MKTVGRHHPRGKPIGTFTCDTCGVLWHRHEMRRKRDGLWYCPDDYPGKDSVTLSEQAARDGTRPQGRKYHPDGAQWDSENGQGAVVQLTDGDHLP